MIEPMAGGGRMLFRVGRPGVTARCFGAKGRFGEGREAVMKKHAIAWIVNLSVLVASIPSAHSQPGPVSGLYEITSGRYIACCGLFGTPWVFDLPNAEQSFV